ncbi:MAG TPA: alanine--tRNA ligase [Actinomycetota bacterium]|nr:alanine--tRNA ligase [Actinomycetota bacterium]
MEADKIRESFLSFFEERGHRRVPSSSLIPPPESGLLLTNAGMNQFIPYFLGQAKAPFDRAVTVQKCFRANDIENVGHTARHLTFFEMLGNFSFGEYFKAESIAWGFELVTEVWGVEPDRLWATVYEEDAEALQAWLDVGLPAERIVRRGKLDPQGEPANYWWTHAAGPAGPCSEIFVDRGPKYGPDGGPDVDEERFMEIWNHVFIQERVDEHCNLVGELPAKNIDTGSSLERVVTVLQGLDNVFETDLFRPLVEVGESLSGKKHGEDERTDVSLKVIAEHGRATSFLIADGVQPSNEGRGYILRRMLRRVVSHARRLGIDKPVMEPLVRSTVDLMGHAYPELRENQAFVLQVAGSEEERFGATLRQGMTLFGQAAERTPPGGTMPGDDAFKLFDTFGFPPQLTEELAAEAGRSVDMDRFSELMEEQRRRARESAKKVPIGLDAGGAPPSEFVGYERLDADATVAALLDPEFRELGEAEEGQEVRLFLDVTPFYAEAGGQVGDAGLVRTGSGLVRVTDAQWAGPHSIMHVGVVESGEVRAGQDGHAEVDVARREATARAHTSTHIVHWTLKHLLGEHARQAGSLVAPGRLRFDFPHPSAVPRELLEHAEEEANLRLARDDAVRVYETTFDEAKAQGAVMLFGEKYGDLVRVVEVGDYSKELCGGTHVPTTGTIAVIRILHEGSIGAGMRRVEALVGPDALKEINLERELLRAIVEALGAGDPHHAPEWARELVERVKRLESELGKLKTADVASLVGDIVSRASVVAGARLVASVQDADADELRKLAQKAVNKLEGDGGAAVVLGSSQGSKALLVAACSAGLVARGVTAPTLLEEAASKIGGGAGGKEILAFAGGPNAGAVPDAIDAIPARLEELLRRN